MLCIVTLFSVMYRENLICIYMSRAGQDFVGTGKMAMEMWERGAGAERKIDIGSVRTGGLRRFLSRPHDRYTLW